MHDVLDLRDLVPDEAEQRLHSGFSIGTLLERARDAAARACLAELEEIAVELEKAPRADDWPFVEPSDEASVLGGLADLPILEVDPDELRARLHGAWLGRCVGNTMGKPIEGLRRDEVEIYLDRLPKALSGGQRQRVAIGRSIVRDPKVFLFDEPLSNLDAVGVRPEHIEITKEGGWSGRVIYSENLGADSFLYVDAGEAEPTIIRQEGKSVYDSADLVTFRPRQNTYHLFDKDGRPPNG